MQPPVAERAAEAHFALLPRGVAPPVAPGQIFFVDHIGRRPAKRGKVVEQGAVAMELGEQAGATGQGEQQRARLQLFRRQGVTVGLQAQGGGEAQGESGRRGVGRLR